MFDNPVVMKKGRCVECGGHEQDGYACDEMFHFPLAWEHNDPQLYALHFWLVACYIIQHPSIYTTEAYKHLVDLFKEAYDNQWDTAYILKKSREKIKGINHIATPLKSKKRQRVAKECSFTIGNIYIGGEENAIENIKKWKDSIRNELD